jgi:hypothetical protein
MIDKIIDYSIIICLIIIIIFLYNKIRKIKERFQNPNSCNFLPWGPNFNACVNHCQGFERKGLWDNITGTLCDKNTCNEICLKCDNISHCEWLNKWDEKQKIRRNKLFNINLNQNNLPVPKKRVLNAINYNNKIKLTWDNLDDALEYNIHYAKTSNSNINIIQINEKDSISYEIDGLTQNSEYSFILYAINSYGTSEPSNIIIIKT